MTLQRPLGIPYSVQIYKFIHFFKRQGPTVYPWLAWNYVDQARLYFTEICNRDPPASVNTGNKGVPSYKIYTFLKLSSLSFSLKSLPIKIYQGEHSRFSFPEVLTAIWAGELTPTCRSGKVFRRIFLMWHPVSTDATLGRSGSQSFAFQSYGWERLAEAVTDLLL